MEKFFKHILLKFDTTNFVEFKMTTIECPKCRELSLPLDYPASKCENCHKTYKYYEIRRKWAKAFLSNQLNATSPSEEKFVSCAECMSNTMIYYKMLNRWVCFTCLNSWKKNDLKICNICCLHSKKVTTSGICIVCIECWDIQID